jgi:Transposase DDE domain/Transposase domain (DUF772)
MGHRSGESRQQAALFPVMLEELVGEQAVVRVVDAWVDTLDMKKLGFARASAQVMGRPPYDPADLLKLYLWGYLNVVRSSRLLERECLRNVECMWLQDLKSRHAAVARDLDTLGQSRRTMVVQSEPQSQVMRSLHGAAGYNLQTAVETTSHLIVAHDVNAEASDQRQLQPMAQAASAVLDKACTVVADAGYANGEQLAALDALGIESFVAVKRGVNNTGDGGLYDRTAFSYDASSDSFICPAGQLLKRKQLSNKDNMVVYAASREDCGVCPKRPQCTGAAQRFVTRHLYEEALQANEKRLAEHPEMMGLRRQTVEHPYGTIKHQILGNARLLMRGIKGAQDELSLAVLVYNLKRAINMKGAAWMRQALQG